MKALKTLIALLALPFLLQAQYKIVKTPSSARDNVWTFISVPYEAKDSIDKKYPLIISFGGAGTTSTAIPSKDSDSTRLTSEDGLPKRIKGGWSPQAVNPLTNQKAYFIVIQAQDRWGCPWPPAMDYTLNYCLKTLRLPIDTNNIFVTGLSWGGSCAPMYASTDTLHSRRVKAVVSASPQADFLDNLPKIPLIVKDSVPYRFWSGTLDVNTTYAKKWLKAYTDAGGIGDLTLYSGGHGGWGALYGTATKEPTVKWSYLLPNGYPTQVNMYEWFATFTTPYTAPVNDKIIYDIKNAKRITVETVEGKTVIFQ